jgi:hypothetical protein
MANTLSGNHRCLCIKEIKQWDEEEGSYYRYGIGG